MNFALQEIVSAWCQVFEPPPRMTVSEWANERRVLSPEGSAYPGKYSSDATPYAVEWMDSVNDPLCTGTILMVASQLGKTEVINNIVGYFIDIDPATILMVQPTEKLAEAWSKERLAPMLRDTPVLAGKVADAKTRDSGNTILHKVFDGGNLAIAGANAPSGLASRPRRVVLCDEEDRYPVSAGKEGDPVSLAIRRTENYWNPVVFETSTPTVKGLSRIEARFEESDQRRWWCPCPECGHLQTMKWSQVRWVAEDGSDAWYLCENPACKEPHRTDEERRWMIRHGRWVATYPHRNLRGYHLNGLANLFRHKKGYKSRLHQMVDGFLSAKKKGKEALRTWVNTFLAETWEDEGERPAWEPLMQRRENWGEFPEGGLVITAGVDLQGDRVEVEIVAWGEGEESWSLQHRTIIGNFHNPGVQQELDDILGQKWMHPLSGVTLEVTATLIDSGNKPRAVYAYTKRRASRRIFAVKGKGGPGLPVISRPTKQGVERALLFTVGTDTIKDTIYSRLTLADTLKTDDGKPLPSPGYMHFPSERPEDWFRQLVSESKVTRYRDGVPYSKFENPSNSRNEALDMRVYAIGALGLLNVNWARLKKAIIPPQPEKPEEKAAAPATQPKRQARRAGGFVNGW